ncbi:hypothetical protein SPBR_07630 [Sporothrix brasiliensis 5110]|uniref:2EXR domain-containing protein n=1 Tax=Sporothrix brasiliensis 5110 TaxID=1398154 RepID=A0A0C2IV33_9PEZI|nr:uncharacterized protein SPBR_07630 [Sporothrix brasiliensis 5110]KIH88867.1 hypothetical protein SPBR_07630 [Sporothrix brasiliensis 5110]
MHSFKRFSDLPAELRVSIWRLSRQPRVVEVWYDADADCCRTTARPPALLHVNREARAEALHQDWYRRAFRTSSHPRDHYIYFSPTFDVLYLPRHGLMGYDDTARDFTLHVRDTAEHVRALAIDHVRTDTIRPWEPYNKLMLLLSFPHVQEAMLVVGSQTMPAASPPSQSPVGRLHDRRTLRRRSHESIESISTPSKGDVVLVDPQGDTSAIMEVINNVIESFSREIEAVAAASDHSIGIDNSSNSSTSPLPKDDSCSPGRTLPHLPCLIPKAIAYHRQQRRRRRHKHRPAICA